MKSTRRQSATVADHQTIDLDEILVEIGETGAYRWVTWTLWSAVVLFSTLPYLSYIFTTGHLQYRCAVPECEAVGASQVAGNFTADFLHFALPPAEAAGKCLRYASSRTVDGCSADAFNQSQLERCDDRSLVFATDEVTIQREFALACDPEGDFKLAAIGTLAYMGSCMLLPLCAVISDRFGRRPILIATLLLAGVSGVIQSYASSYRMFAAMTFLTALVSGGTFMTIFVLAVESSGPAQRVFVGTMLSAVYSAGQAGAGLLASQVREFRLFLRLLFVPSFVLLGLIWLVPESVRWLLAKGRVREARRILQRAAKLNGRELAVSTQARLAAAQRNEMASAEVARDAKANEAGVEAIATTNPFVLALRSRTLIGRLINCIVIWITNAFIYYGMNIHAVALAGSKYSNFIAVNLAEVPAIFAAYYLMERFGRNRILCGFLALNGVACWLAEFVVPGGGSGSRMVLYLVGKCGVTVSFTVLYVYTSELFPTRMRHTFMNTCSTCGAFGSMLAPQTPLLAALWAPLPMLLFGGAALVSSGLVLLLPETLNEQLPDTVEDAERIGRSSRRRSLGAVDFQSI